VQYPTVQTSLIEAAVTTPRVAAKRLSTVFERSMAIL
jgi:hypothetical protein